MKIEDYSVIKVRHIMLDENETLEDGLKLFLPENLPIGSGYGYDERPEGGTKWGFDAMGKIYFWGFHENRNSPFQAGSVLVFRLDRTDKSKKIGEWTSEIYYHGWRGKVGEDTEIKGAEKPFGPKCGSNWKKMECNSQ